MESTLKLERRHEKLAQAAEDLELAIRETEENKESLKSAHKNFKQLLKMTDKHLSQVDHILYPQILQINNRKLRKNLSRIIIRSGHVRTEVGFLIDAWTSKRAIKNPAVFQSVAWHFLTILKMRLNGERRIYTILNKCDLPQPPPVEANQCEDTTHVIPPPF